MVTRRCRNHGDQEMSVTMVTRRCCCVVAELWECTKLRCGETRMTQSRCHCSSDCLQAGDCCSNYKHVCLGETAAQTTNMSALVRPLLKLQTCLPG